MKDRTDGSADAKKGRRTQRRTVALGARRTRAAALQEWLQDQLGLAQKRKADAHAVKNPESGFGVTLDMQLIGRKAAQREPEFVAGHKYPNRAMRRSGRGGGIFVRNTSYVNPARDAKPGRHLRGRDGA